MAMQVRPDQTKVEPDLSQAGMPDVATQADLVSVGPDLACNNIDPCPGRPDLVMAVPEEVLKTRILPQIPVGRLGQPEEIANTYAWLASDEASYINGAVIEVSGGVTI